MTRSTSTRWPTSSVGSIDPEGIWYGLTTKAWISSARPIASATITTSSRSAPHARCGPRDQVCVPRARRLPPSPRPWPRAPPRIPRGVLGLLGARLRRPGSPPLARPRPLPLRRLGLRRLACRASAASSSSPSGGGDRLGLALGDALGVDRLALLARRSRGRPRSPSAARRPGRACRPARAGSRASLAARRPCATTSSRSTLGECTGKVRSTPTPNDCLRTVNVSRAPAPRRAITTPSNTWVRLRVPSTTWKWTRTRSPGANRGTRLSWRCSMLSMIVLMGSCEGGAGLLAARVRPETTPDLWQTTGLRSAKARGAAE